MAAPTRRSGTRAKPQSAERVSSPRGADFEGAPSARGGRLGEAESPRASKERVLVLPELPKGLAPGPAREVDLRQSVVETARAMSRMGLSPGRSGNVSARSDGGMLITPTGLAYDTLTAEDIVEVAPDGTTQPGALKPSSEWRFHQAVYATRPDVHAIVHTHSLHAVVLACAHRPIPPFHYMVAAGGGRDIPCVPYATFGTEDLGRHIAAGLSHRDACLMANHGQIAVGTTLARALALAHDVETLAEQYMKVLLLGEVHLLDDAEMDRVLARFRTYGQNAQTIK